MKSFVALFVITLAAIAQAGHVPTTWNSWNNWDDWHGAHPYAVNEWSSAWPTTSLYNGHNGWYGGKTVVQANVAKINPWGLPLAYGNGHSGYAYGINHGPWGTSSVHGGKTIVQANVAKINPWGLPLAYGNGYSSYGYGINHGAWPVSSLHGGYHSGVKTVVQGNHWGLPLAYGHGHNNYWGVGVPAAKYVAANPGSVHVAPLVGHAINQKLIVA